MLSYVLGVGCTGVSSTYTVYTLGWAAFLKLRLAGNDHQISTEWSNKSCFFWLSIRYLSSFPGTNASCLVPSCNKYLQEKALLLNRLIATSALGKIIYYNQLFCSKPFRCLNSVNFASTPLQWHYVIAYYYLGTKQLTIYIIDTVQVLASHTVTTDTWLDSYIVVPS